MSGEVLRKLKTLDGKIGDDVMRKCLTEAVVMRCVAIEKGTLRQGTTMTSSPHKLSDRAFSEHERNAR